MTCMRNLLERNKQLGAVNQMDRLTTLESETQMQASCIREYMKTAQGWLKVFVISIFPYTWCHWLSS